MVDSKMPEVVRVTVWRSREIGFLEHREEHKFIQGPQHCVVYRHGLRASLEGECLDRHSSHESGFYLLKIVCVSELDGRLRFHVSHMQCGVQKIEEAPCVGLGTQDVKVALVFSAFYLTMSHGRSNRGTLNRSP